MGLKELLTKINFCLHSEKVINTEDILFKAESCNNNIAIYSNAHMQLFSYFRPGSKKNSIHYMGIFFIFTYSSIQIFFFLSFFLLKRRFSNNMTVSYFLELIVQCRHSRKNNFFFKLQMFKNTYI